MTSTEQQIIKAVALLDNEFRDLHVFGMQTCPFCKTYTKQTISDSDFIGIAHALDAHTEDCPVTIARSLLKESMGAVKLFSVYYEEDLRQLETLNRQFVGLWIEFNEQSVREQWKQRFSDNHRKLIVKEIGEL